MTGKFSLRLGAALMLPIALAFGCSEAPTEPESPRVTSEEQEPTAAGAVADGDVQDVVGPVTEAGSAVTPEGLRSRLGDPLIEELLAGLEDAGLQESMESSLAPLAEMDPSDETGSVESDLQAAREVLRKASVDESLTVDDEIALGVLQLTLGEGGANM